MKHLISTILFLVFVNQSVDAQTLVLHHADGKTTDIELLTMPQVKFDADKVLITSPVINLQFPKSDILSFTYKDVASSINDMYSDTHFSQSDGKIIFNNVKPTDQIAIYAINGSIIPVEVKHADSQAIISLSSIPTGIYLLSINGKTSKFIKK